MSSCLDHAALLEGMGLPRHLIETLYKDANGANIGAQALIESLAQVASEPLCYAMAVDIKTGGYKASNMEEIGLDRLVIQIGAVIVDPNCHVIAGLSRGAFDPKQELRYFGDAEVESFLAEDAAPDKFQHLAAATTFFGQGSAEFARARMAKDVYNFIYGWREFLLKRTSSSNERVRLVGHLPLFDWAVLSQLFKKYVRVQRSAKKLERDPRGVPLVAVCDGNGRPIPSTAAPILDHQGNLVVRSTTIEVRGKRITKLYNSIYEEVKLLETPIAGPAPPPPLPHEPVVDKEGCVSPGHGNILDGPTVQSFAAQLASSRRAVVRSTTPERAESVERSNEQFQRHLSEERQHFAGEATVFDFLNACDVARGR